MSENNFSLTRFTGWRHDIENRAAILHRGQLCYHLWRSNLNGYKWEAPDEIDPRGFLTVHNQGNVGSCQGQSLADSCEAAHFIETGEVVQLSRAWSYLNSQEHDGILGRDSGSTLDGGTKCAALGIPLESKFDYVTDYGRMLQTYKSQRANLAEKAKDWRFLGEVPLSSYEDIYNFLASGAGAVQIGIMWGLPDKWEHKSYSPGRGGHAVVFCGYLKVASWPRPGLLLKNSWGEAWPSDHEGGYCIVHPDAVTQMCKAQWNVFVGRCKPVTPKPKDSGDI